MAGMPIIGSAIKKLKQSKVKAERNRNRRRVLKEAVDSYKKSPTPKNLAAVFSRLDRLVKVDVMHKNTAARLKSRLFKKLPAKKS